MTPKKEYLELPDKVLLATILERLDNHITRLDKHVEDDKQIAIRLGDLENRFWKYMAMCSCLAFVVGKLSIKWF